jgi:hypothetical protein
VSRGSGPLDSERARHRPRSGHQVIFSQWHISLPLFVDFAPDQRCGNIDNRSVIFVARCNGPTAAPGKNEERLAGQGAANPGRVPSGEGFPAGWMRGKTHPRAGLPPHVWNTYFITGPKGSSGKNRSSGQGSESLSADTEPRPGIGCREPAR